MIVPARCRDDKSAKATPGRPARPMAGALLGLIVVGAALGDEPAPKVIPAHEARHHIGERCTVEMTVKSSKNAAPRRTYFLDSEEDYRDEKNLAIVIDYDDAEAFRRAGIDDPAEHYRGKALRVTGKIIDEADQVRIRVTDPGQIKVVEPVPPGCSP